MTISSVAAVVDSTGISAPALTDILDYLQSLYKQIFGEDVYLGADSQDGQLLGILAQAIDDCNSSAIAVYNAFSPTTAQGAGLSSVIKINGLERQGSTYSTADLTITGTAGTIITDGVAQDTAGYKWSLPASVTIGTSGSVVVTATCQTAGAIYADIGTITKILTPTRGWQAVSNATAASVGVSAEIDAKVRQRQSISTELPSQSVMAGIIGAVANITGVTRCVGYENVNDTADSNGIPAHSISLVVDGGDSATIAQTIANKKTPGTGTYGTTSEVVTGPDGIPTTINFYRPTLVEVQVTVTLAALTGYLSTIGSSIQTALVDYINSLSIGEDCYITRLYTPANLSGDSDSDTYDITGLTIGSNGGAQGSANVPIAFNEAAYCTTSDITISVP